MVIREGVEKELYSIMRHSIGRRQCSKRDILNVVYTEISTVLKTGAVATLDLQIYD
jgi:hypothetical protein